MKMKFLMALTFSPILLLTSSGFVLAEQTTAASEYYK